MANYGPGAAFILIGGRNVSSETFTLTDTVGSMTEQVNGLGETWERYQNIGLGKITLEASGGLYDDKVAGIIEALKGMGATEQLVSYGMAGYAAGADVVLLNGVLATVFNRIVARDALTKAEAEYTVNGVYLRGVVVSGLGSFLTDPFDSKSASVDQALAPRNPIYTITANTLANPTVVNTGLIPHGLITGDIVLVSGSNSTPTINGERAVIVISPTTFSVPVNVTVAGTAGTFVKVTSPSLVADLHVPALVLGGFTNVIVQLVHSVDNSVWVALGPAFTAVTLAGASQRQTITGPVQRYLAITGDFTGAGAGESVVAYVAVSR